MIGFGPRAPRSRKLDPFDATIAFMDCFRLYPNQYARLEAAQIWQDTAADYPGGEEAMRDAILARFATGMLLQHPYSSGLQKFRPTFEKFLLGRHWENPDSAPDVAEEPRRAPESIVERDARVAKANAERTARELDAEVRATAEKLEASRVAPERLVTVEQLEELKRERLGRSPSP